MTPWSSRERVLAAVRYQEPDHVPLVFGTFGFHPPAHLAWSNEIEEAERWLSLGVDALLRLGPPVVFHPDVKVRGWEEQIPGERWPLMVKEYDTPAGILRQEVYRTEDWVSDEWPGHHGESRGIQLIDDYNVVRSRRFLVEAEEDLEKLKYLLYPLSGDALTRFREQAAAIGREAGRLGVAVEGQGSMGTDLVTWFCGVDRMVMMAMDKPELFAALLDIVQAWDKHNTEILLDTPADIIYRRGWYEGTAFWSPRLYRRFFLPRFQELVRMIHQGDRLASYRLSTGFMPLLDLFLEAGYDGHLYIDPVQGGPGTDLRKVKRVFDGKISVLGGINAAVTLEQGTREEIRQAVFDAIEILGPAGLVLWPVDSIFASTPWESVQTVIEAWKEKVRIPR
jgi:hypothetical protein